MIQTFDEPIIEDKLPVFLKVLCILTFVGCGLSLIGIIYNLAAGTNAQSTIDKLQLQQGNEMIDGMVAGMKSKITVMDKWMKIQTYVSIANLALCLTGALLMWKRKKAGFYLYTLAQILLVAVSIGYYTVIKDVPFLGITTLITQIIMIIFYGAFVIMYAANLKHMR